LFFYDFLNDDAMTPNPISVSYKLDNGKEISIETGKLARQADGSVV